MNTIKIRGARVSTLMEKTPLRLDNFGTKCRVPFVYTLAPPELIASIWCTPGVGHGPSPGGIYAFQGYTP